MPKSFEVYMLLKDRKRLARLIEIQEVSRRQVAIAAGWKSHTYLLRLLSGEARTVEPEHAVKIATFLGVDVADLFTPKATNGAGQVGKRTRERAVA
jgi:transcriptional regulator with XRE-family HTH domain